MVTLLAYTPDERWAFARDGERIVLLKPPFRQDVAASDAEVERAVTILGFLALERDFASRRALLDFLSEESVQAWKQRAPSKDLPTLRDEMLAAFTVADLDRHLARGRKKIAAGKLDEAQTLLSRVLTADALTYEQREAISGMLEQMQSIRHEQEQLRRQALKTAVSGRFRRAANDNALPRAEDASPGVLHPTG
jgi:hypothetical protein